MPWTVFSEENFRSMVEHAPIGIVIIDRELKWRFVNDRFCEITGYSRGELADKTFLDITHKEDRGMNVKLYNQLLSGEVNDYSYEKRYVRKDGKILWVRLAVAAIRDVQEYSHMVVSVEDIDASKKNQEMLEAKNDELDTLLYKASHDLKSPVTTLAGLCHLLRREQESLGRSELFQHLEETVVRLKNQNESLLDLTRIQDWKLLEERISLARLIEGVISELPNAAAKIEVLNVDVELTTDGMLLALAVRRIVENALIYVRPGMKADVRIEYVRLPGQHKIAIADHGPGIPQQELGHILGMFYRATEHSRGSGMGLYIAKKAIDKLRGEIVVESTEGEGSVFSLFLP